MQNRYTRAVCSAVPSSMRVSAMDPIFGLPCMKESRRMDSARSRNQAQEKILTRKFQALDVDKRNRSSKLLSQRGTVEAFRSRVEQTPQRLSDMPAGLTRQQQERYKKLFLRQAGLSMTVGELEKQLSVKKARKPAGQTPTFLQTVTEDDNSDSTQDTADNALTSEGGEDTDEKSCDYVVRPTPGTCLPINRKKHAMKAAWDRATTDDMRFASDQGTQSSSMSTAPSRDTSRFLYADQPGGGEPSGASMRTHLEVKATIPFSKASKSPKRRRSQLKIPVYKAKKP